MKIVYLNRIMFSDNIQGLTLFPFIFIRKNRKNDKVLLNHEKIHIRQQLELLIIPFYIWYILEWMIKGYWNISFEREAYDNEKNLDYLKQRKFFNFTNY